MLLKIFYLPDVRSVYYKKQKTAAHIRELYSGDLFPGIICRGINQHYRVMEAENKRGSKRFFSGLKEVGTFPGKEPCVALHVRGSLDRWPALATVSVLIIRLIADKAAPSR